MEEITEEIFKNTNELINNPTYLNKDWMKGFNTGIFLLTSQTKDNMIKWIKEIKLSQYGEQNSVDVSDLSYGTILWIKKIYNITKEDLQ